MTIEQAIRKAVEGGWGHKAPKGAEDFYFNDIFLDPLFWQSLGKALGWPEEVEVIHSHPVESDIVRKKVEGWKWYWHFFIDHLADGGTAESFFKDL